MVGFIDNPYAINNNKAINGGAVFAERDSDISINYKTTMANNTARKQGGALHLTNSGLVFDYTVQSVLIFVHNAAIGKFLSWTITVSRYFIQLSASYLILEDKGI